MNINFVVETANGQQEQQIGNSKKCVTHIFGRLNRQTRI